MFSITEIINVTHKNKGRNTKTDIYIYNKYRYTLVCICITKTALLFVTRKSSILTAIFTVYLHAGIFCKL